jgi:muramoyltetrapeptide carboxypeptidase
MAQPKRIGVVAPGTRIDPELAARVKAFAADSYLDQAPQIFFHQQCFYTAGHFAGDDAARLAAFVEFANDPSLDALWFARGGYGACRIAEAAIAQLNERVRAPKPIWATATAACCLAGLYRNGFPNVAHGPMPVDMIRAGGEAAVKRALAYRSSAPMNRLSSR